MYNLVVTIYLKRDDIVERFVYKSWIFIKLNWEGIINKGYLRKNAVVLTPLCPDIYMVLSILCRVYSKIFDLEFFNGFEGIIE